MSPTYEHMNKQASFHSKWGSIWRLSSKFLLVRFRVSMAHENNSSSVRIAQLSSENNAVHFVRFHKFLELPPEASAWAHSRCRSTDWSRGIVRRKFSDFELILLNVHPRPTIFIAKAAITLNNVGSVLHVNMLMNVASHWYWAFKNNNGQSRTSWCMPRNKVDSEADGFTETTSASQPIPKWKLAHKQFLNFFFFTQSLGAYLIYLEACCELNWHVYTPMGVQFPCLINICSMLKILQPTSEFDIYGNTNTQHKHALYVG